MPRLGCPEHCCATSRSPLRAASEGEDHIDICPTPLSCRCGFCATVPSVPCLLIRTVLTKSLRVKTWRAALIGAYACSGRARARLSAEP